MGIRAEAWMLGMIIGATSLMGCKSDEEKICAHMAELHENEENEEIGDDKMKDCVSSIKKQLESCEDADEFRDCMLDVDEMKDSVGCMRKCTKGGGSKGGDDDSGKGTASKSSGDGCPNGAECMNRCKSECESKHGKMIDTAKLRECAQKGGGADCASRATNQSARRCFLTCRGLPAN